MVTPTAEFYHFILRALLEPIAQANGKSPVLNIGVIHIFIIVDAADTKMVRSFYEHFIKMIAEAAENSKVGVTVVLVHTELHRRRCGNASLRGLLPAREGNTHYRAGRNAEMIFATCADIKAQQRSNIYIMDTRFYFAGIALERI